MNLAFVETGILRKARDIYFLASLKKIRILLFNFYCLLCGEKKDLKEVLTHRDIYEHLNTINGGKCTSLYEGVFQLNRPFRIIGDSSNEDLFSAETLSDIELVCEIREGLFYFDKFFICDSSDFFYNKLSHFPTVTGNVHRVFQQKKFPPVKRLSGQSILINCGNWYHFLYEGLGSLLLMEKAGYNIENAAQFIIYGIPTRAMVECLALIGVRQEKFIMAKSEYHNYRCESLLMTTYYAHRSSWLAEAYLPFIRHFHNPAMKTPKRIYVSRAKARHRKIQNEAELETILFSFGFQKIFNEDLSLIEQITYFQNADFIIGPHGANLANLAFAKKNTIICEIINGECKDIWNCYWQFSQNLSLKYHVFFAKPAKPYFNEMGNLDFLNANLIVDVKLLTEYLNEQLKPSFSAMSHNSGHGVE